MRDIVPNRKGRKLTDASKPGRKFKRQCFSGAGPIGASLLQLDCPPAQILSGLVSPAQASRGDSHCGLGLSTEALRRGEVFSSWALPSNPSPRGKKDPFHLGRRLTSRLLGAQTGRATHKTQRDNVTSPHRCSGFLVSSCARPLVTLAMGLGLRGTASVTVI